MPFPRTRWDPRRSARPFVATLLFIGLLAGYAALVSRTDTFVPASLRVFPRHGPSDGGGINIGLGAAREHSLLRARMSDAATATSKAPECRNVHLARDQCAFIRNNCGDDEAGLLHYLTFYYCTLGASLQPLAFILLAGWLGLLFTTIGIAASDFFSVNLSTISGVLGLSESLAGVTFLAFGNGSPDVFSTFAAMGSNSGSMAVGELIGAASFITAVVAGAMALVREFRVSRRTFVRDVGFFVVAVSFAMIFLADGQLHLWECCVMIGFYLFYVFVVVGWHWWTQRRRRRRLKDAASRGHFYSALGQERDELEPYRDEPDDDDDDEAALVGRGDSEDATDITALERGPRIGVEGGDGQAPSPDEEDERDRLITAEMTSSMRVNRPRWSRSNTTTITAIRPSLVGALEFRAILSSLHRERNMHLRPLWDRIQTEIPFHSLPDSNRGGHNRTTSLGRMHAQQSLSPLVESPRPPREEVRSPRFPRERALSSGDSPRNLENESLASPTRHKFSKEPSPVMTSADGLLAPPPGLALCLAPELPVEEPPAEDGVLATQHPRHGLQLQIPSPSGRIDGSSSPRSPISPAISPFPALSESPMPMSTPPLQTEERTAYFPPLLLRRESSIPPFDEPMESPKPVRWWPYRFLPPPHILFGTLFPTLQGWSDKTIWDRFLSLVSVPSIFLLVITLPVVETETPEEDLDLGPAAEVHTSLVPENPAPAVSAVEGGTVQPETEWQEYRRRRNTSTHSALRGSPALLAVDADRSAHGRGRDGTRYRTRNRNRDEGARNSAETATRQLSQPGLERSSPKPSSNQDRDRSTETSDEAAGWNRWLVALQLFTGPLFVVLIIWANMADDLESPGKDLVRWLLSSLVLSLVLLAVLLLTTTPEKKPRYHFLLCFLGFVISVAWISTVAGEVVGVLKAFGVIMGISEAILGLTIFAVGNSLGDLVADVTVARLGYPVMALAACFGGPMLNILLGVGLGGAWMTISAAKAKHAKHPDRPLAYKPYHIQVGGTLIISAVTVLVTLLVLLVVVPANRWVMSRRIGWGLIGIWTASTIVNLAVELTGVWGEIS